VATSDQFLVFGSGSDVLVAGTKHHVVLSRDLRTVISYLVAPIAHVNYVFGIPSFLQHAAWLQ
jgi:hypothetical protein